MKKVLSLLLAVLMVFTLLPVSALADGETPGTAETTAETETTPVPEVTPEPEITPEPETTPEPENTPEPARVTVRFHCMPEETTILVYEAENDEVELEPEKDGSYLLVPGTYVYVAICEGYVSIFEELIIEETDAATGEEMIIDVVLEPGREPDVVATYSATLTNAEITAKLDSIKQNTYPEGSTYTGSFGGGSQCYAFGRLLANTVFGSYPWNCSAYSNGYTDGNGWKLAVAPDSNYNVEPGDLIEVRPSGLSDHTAIVWKVSGDTIYVAECWGSSGGKIAWGYFNGSYSTLSSISSKYGASSVYIWKHPGGSESKSYLSKCDYYPSYLTVQMTKDYRVWSLPCGNETDSASSVVKTVASGTSLTVTALYKNGVTTSDHYWYRVRLSDGTVGYVYAPFCKVTNYCDTAIKNGISASGKDVPASLPVSKSYPVDWTITSSNADISAISGTVHTYGTTMSYGRTEQVRSKNLNNSELDSAMHFDWISSPGSYDFYIKVQVKNYYCANNSNTLQSKTIEKTVLNGPIKFTAGDSGHTTHSYTSKVVAPTCTEQGYTLYTCSVCSASYKDNYTDAKGHSWNSGTVTTAATCEKSGVKTYTCTACQTKKTETIAATGHKLVYGSWEGSCTERPHRRVSCANCDYQYTEYNMEGNWSDWSTTKPTGVADEYIETQQRYRTRNKLTTTGTSNTMSGWTLSGSEKVWSDYGSWSDWSTDAVSASDSTQVETTTLYGYYYYYCSNCGAHMHGYGTCYTWAGGCGAKTYSSGWNQGYFPYSWSSSTSDWHGTGKYVATINGENWFKWDNHTATGYRYRTRTQQTVYSFYKWDDWSGWVSGSNAPAATDTMQVEKQTLYRYDLYATGTHKWDSGVVTTPAKPGIEGVKTYTCTACKQTRTEVIPALPITYTVSYDANGGSGAPAAQTKTKDVALTLSSTKPTRTGYKFLGWAASKTATSAQYQPGGSYTANAAVTLYAVWKENDYTVSYDANGGTGAPAAQSKTHGTALTLSSTKPTRTGYKFLGWAASKTATSAQYQPGGSYTANAAVTLYAVWKENDYTVSYDANGGTGAPAAQSKTHGTALTLSSTKPTRTGYTFLGWAASKTATSAQYQPGGSYTANAAVTLYAVWKTNDYTVSYDANGGTGAPAAQTKTHGTALTLSSTKPTRTGYTFLGWAASKTATSVQYQPGGSYTANAAVTLYAVWKENAPTYATTLTVSSATASQGKEVSLNVSLAGNPGIIGINFQITYDKTRLKLIGYADGAMKDWSVGIGESEKAIWIDEAADVINGNILTLKFQVLDNAPDGLAEVTVMGFKAAALDESAVNANIVAGGVTVTSRIPGDVNDDGEVDIFDCVRLKKYLAGFNVTINASNADVNGDGEVDIFDCVRLKKYLAGMSVELK